MNFNSLFVLPLIRRLLSLSLVILSTGAIASDRPQCARTLRADIVAIDQPLMFNRLGAHNINGMIFALKRDVVDDSEPARPLMAGDTMRRGHVFLRPDKRPRPLVLRVAQQDCLEIKLTNLLTTRSNPREPIEIPPTTIVSPPTTLSPPPPKDIAGAFPSPRFVGEADDQVADRMVGFHVQGMQLFETIVDDATMVGRNPSGLVAPGGTITYRLYAEHEGAFLATSHGATFGGDATAGNDSNGLFGAVNVEPLHSRFYRSQLTEEELRLASSTDELDEHHIGGQRKEGPRKSTIGQPIVDYEAVYPNTSPWTEEGKAGLPILNMLHGDEIVHSEINAIIAGPDADGSWTSKCPKKDETPPADEIERKAYDEKFKDCPYPLERVGRTNPSLPDRLESFREFTVIFHDQVSKTNAFPHFYSHMVKDANGVDIPNPLAQTLKSVGDVFMVNYGSAGIGSEMIANRLGVGPMHDCLSCAAEEFFLTSHAVGDPAMVVDVPANFGLDQCRPVSVQGDPSTPLSDTTHLADCGPEHPNNIHTIVGDKAKSMRLVGPKATRALYPDDPSNVHHSYINDHVKFRNLHTGKEHHIFHLHNHQWLFSPNDDNSNYLDAQAIGPGSSYTYEISFGGSGNRNKSAGDAIFHCHLYPHFAQGMWELWRVHDVLEVGTALEVSSTGRDNYHLKPFALQDGMPARDPQNPGKRSRALPDGEIVAGTPIPAIIPLPGKAMAPMPGRVFIVAKQPPLSGPESKPQDKIKIAPVLGSVAEIDRSDTAEPGALTEEEKKANSETTPLGNILNPRNLKNPGFPFWIAGIEHSVGQRPPTPPLDMLPALPEKEANSGGWDGGLPRHALDGIAASRAVISQEEANNGLKPSEDYLSRYDLTKKLKIARPFWFPEDGDDIEKVAMAFHAVRNHRSYAVDLDRQKGDTEYKYIKEKNYITNGSGKPVAGAPFHNPCVDDKGVVLNKDVIGSFFDGHGGFGVKGRSPFTSDNPRIYKGADIQFDAVFNKAGWHFPQERIIALWEDVRAIISKAKAPEPLVIRNNTFDCTNFLHTNLVPEIYELDDYQVRTTTDIIGQHIHLPKWDLTTTDGSGNGWNYEDGTLAPGAVRERIVAINKYNHLASKPVVDDVEGRPVYTSENLRKADRTPIVGELKPLKHPYFDESYPFKLIEGNRTQNWLGARTTMQRWFFDPVVNSNGVHRGLGIIFTHDHFGPSTHQQVGLYATVLVEPAGSKWSHNETGDPLGGRPDGGPTSWQAIVHTGADTGYRVTDNDPSLNAKSAGRDLDDLDGDGENDSYREFYLEYSDFQHAYLPGRYVGADPNGAIADGKEIDSLLDKVKKPNLSPYLPDETSYKFAINPPIKEDVAQTNPLDLIRIAPACKIFGFNFRRPCAEAISADDPGTFVVNYRNEPVGLRIMDTNAGAQASGQAGDLAQALKTFSRDGGALRAYTVVKATFGNEVSDGGRGVLNAQPREGDRIGGVDGVIGREPTCFPRPLQVKSGSPGVSEKFTHEQGLCQQSWSASTSYAAPLAEDGDPFTPLLRAYDADRVRLKIQAGGHEETHNATIHGVKWLQGGSGYGYAANSGWRNSQQAGISEQFTFASPLVPLSDADRNAVIERYKLQSLGNASQTGFFEKILNYLVAFFRGVINFFASLIGLGSGENHLKPTISIDDIVLRKLRDYLYSMDASTEGYWNGSWGLLRSYSEKGRNDLQSLPNADKSANVFRPVGVCPLDNMGRPQNLREFDISAVLANDMLDNKVNAKLASAASVVFGKLNQREDGELAGTLVYNPRKVAIRDVQIPADPADGFLARSFKGHPDGVLQDPTAIMYVHTSDLTTKKGAPDACMKSGKLTPDPALCPGSYLRLKDQAPVEPLVLRAAAGDCIEVKLRNLIGEKGAPDLLTYYQLPPVIPRFPNRPDGSVLSSNRVRTSSLVGLHPGLVAYDVASDDGTAVGINDETITLAKPESANGAVTYRWYAGDISLRPFDKNSGSYLTAYTPLELGAINLTPADKIKQGLKGLVGALVIEPRGSRWTGLICKDGAGENCLDVVADHQGEGGQRSTRLSTTVTTREGGRYRDLVTVIQKGLTQVYGDGKPVEGISPEYVVSEDSQDSGAMAINYGSEPLWFRYGLLPLLPFTGPKTPPGSPPISFRDVPNAHEAYSESLAYKSKEDILRGDAGEATLGDQRENRIRSIKVSGEPSIPVLTAVAGEEFRMRVLQPAGNARGSVFNLHGHVWQRAPYKCPGESYLGLKDVCPETGFYPVINRFRVGSQVIGENPLSMYMGGEDSVLPAAHYDILLGKAGGQYEVPGDYLYRDQASFGNLAGLWGVVRVRRPSDIQTEAQQMGNAPR